MIDDKKITYLAVLSILIGLIVLFFSLDFEIDDGFFYETNDYVYLDGLVLSVNGDRGIVYACRNITVFSEGLKENEVVSLTGSMYKGRLRVDDVGII